MSTSAFELLKNNNHTNANSSFHNLPLIQYARVVRVIDVQTVIAEAVVQTALSREVYTVTLLNLSSALMEINVQPKLGDKVMLFFVRSHSPDMFFEDTVYDPDATGYNQFSGVGVLMSVVNHAAATVASFTEEDGKPVANIHSMAQLCARFNDAMAVMFCRAVFDSGDERLISMLFGEGRPFAQRFLDKVTHEHGFWKDDDENLIELNAAVTERYSKYAPISKNIQGEQNISIGTDDDGEATHAPVFVQLGEDADISFASLSGIVASIAKDVVTTIGGDKDEAIDGDEITNIGGNREENATGTALYKSVDTDIKSTAPIGLNDGLHATGLGPYLQAENGALTSLQTAASSALTPLAILDALSGGTGLVTGLGSAIVAYCTAMISANGLADINIAKAVK